MLQHKFYTNEMKLFLVYIILYLFLYYYLLDVEVFARKRKEF